jgi:hypothetical protein
MKIKQRVIKEIFIDKNTVKQHLCDVYSEILRDYKNDADMMKESALDFTNIMQSIEESNLKAYCEQGFTSIIFPFDVWDEINNFFDDLRSNAKSTLPGHVKELSINIVNDKDEVIETIGMNYLQY